MKMKTNGTGTLDLTKRQRGCGLPDEGNGMEGSVRSLIAQSRREARR
jgi:hypothetical protein